MKIIDLRSDTVTLPTDEMRQSMFQAKVGDDVLEEDLTIQKLEQKSAQVLGKEAGLFIPSGTMGNLISFLIHCPRGTEALLGDKSHTFIYEAGGISAFGGIHSHQLKNNDDGTIEIDDIQSAIRGENVHFPRTSLISLENTHNMCFGTPISPDYIKSVSNVAKENKLKLHVDGARLFNAAVGLNVDVKDLVEDVDSVTFCLSKGLTAPVGSVLCGDENFIHEARRMRKALGGGMRQAGIIAAAGIVSLEKMIPQLKIDHENAKRLADGISTIWGLSVEAEKVHTNILYFSVDESIMNGSELVEKMRQHQVKFFEVSPNRFRLVTHSNISVADVDTTLQLFDTILQ
ncbi:MAG: low-specificity L-threonine aldolase [Candidatus Marinimicrobia bacterium]|nr:low-specificity L-threonine aldolase [Candidatus Neomarinimicrobiota bacterium]